MNVELEIIIFLCSLICLNELWNRTFRQTLLDSYRHDLFVMRSKLFFYAVDNNINFNSSSYRMMEQYINLRIRFAERMTMIEILMLLKASSKMKPFIVKYTLKFETALQSASSEQYDFYQDLKEQIEKRTLKLLLKSDPVAWILILFTLVPSIILYLIGLLKVENQQESVPMLAKKEITHPTYRFEPDKALPLKLTNEVKNSWLYADKSAGDLALLTV